MDFIARVVKRGHAELHIETPEPESDVPRTLLHITEPAESLGVELVFPLAFSVGSVPVRVKPLRLAAGNSVFDPVLDGPWFFWKAGIADGKAAVYWQLPAPSSVEASDTAAKHSWNKTATTMAIAAASSLKAILQGIPELVSTSFSAGPCAPPKLQGKPVFRADFRYFVKGTFIEGRAYASQVYPLLLAKALGCDISNLAADDPIAAMLLASRSMIEAAPGRIWSGRCFTGGASGHERKFMPVYELFNILSDTDLRLVIQNHVAVKIRGPNLGALFMYRRTVRTDTGTMERVVNPHSFDHDRVDPLFPESVFADGWLDPAHAAMGEDDFIERNEAVIDDLFKAINKDTLSLSSDGKACIRDLYVSLLYPARRSRLDAMIKEGRPMDELRQLPEAIARRAVDASGARVLAALAYGSEPALAFITPWCSRRKQEAIEDETRRLESLLKEGRAEIDGVLADRMAILDKAQSFMQADKLSGDE
jgi:hypothetical protein